MRLDKRERSKLITPEALGLAENAVLDRIAGYEDLEKNLFSKPVECTFGPAVKFLRRQNARKSPHFPVYLNFGVRSDTGRMAEGEKPGSNLLRRPIRNAVGRTISKAVYFQCFIRFGGLKPDLAIGRLAHPNDQNRSPD